MLFRMNLAQKIHALYCCMQDIWLYISEDASFTDFDNEAALVWHETNVPYAVWTPNSVRHKQFVYHPSEAVKHNGSVYAHVFFARAGFSADPSDPEYDQTASFSRTHCEFSYTVCIIKV
jgi:hypothetical protein